MNMKLIGLLLALILVIAGIFLISITEPSGEAGSEPSYGIAGVSEETHPYFLHGVGLIAIGCIAALVVSIKF